MISFQEVSKHNTKSDCWVIIHNKVYNVSDFLGEHPGGSGIILKYAGKDATKAFDPVHPGDTLTKYLSKQYHLGDLDVATIPANPKKVSKQPEAQSQGKSTISDDSSNEVEEFDVEYDEQDTKLAINFSVPADLAPAVPKVEQQVYDDYDEDDDEEDKERKYNNKRKPDIGQIYNLNDFEYVASKTMEKTGWSYYSSGSDDEITLRQNHLSYHQYYFKPKILVDVSDIDTCTTMLGAKVDAPFYITATALGRLGHPDGEKVLTRAAAKQNIIQMIPTLASCSFDDIVDEAIDSQTQWLQLYVNSDKQIVKGIVQHAEKRGIKGIFITVDAPQLGRREKDMRLKDFQDISHVQGDGEEADRSQGAARAISSFIDTSLNWNDLQWFRSITSLPLILKGVQTVEDSLKAMEYDVQGIVLSNHGGRQLEFSKPPIDVLYELTSYLRQSKRSLNGFEIYIDGGIRRATDILKAICLGAKGVGIGRPFLYAMSTYGDDGVFKAIQLLKDEMIMDMRLLGARSIDELGWDFVEKITRPVPDDKLFSSVYKPLDLPKFKL